MTLSAMQFAFLNQTSLPPPKNGSVCNASIARPDSRHCLIDVVRAGIDYFNPEFARVRRRQFRSQLRGDAFHFAFVGADNGMNVGLAGFRFRLRHGRTFAIFALQGKPSNAALVRRRFLRRSCELSGGVFAEFLLQRGDVEKFCAEALEQGRIKRLMPSHGIEEGEETRFVRRDEETDEPFRLIVERVYLIGRRIRHRGERLPAGISFSGATV